MAESRGDVLVVEDEEAVGKLLATLLQSSGFSVHLAADGEEAEDLVRSSPPFLVVVTDKNLPKRTGLDVLCTVKEVTPETEVVLITGDPSLETAIEVLHLGGCGYLVKPFESLEKVRDEVERAAKKARAARVMRAQLRELEGLRTGLDKGPSSLP